MKTITLFILFCFCCEHSRADEGMWIPMFLAKYNQDSMQSRGFRLSPEDVYSVNQISMKDAVVFFGRGCTGAVVSNEGLLFTNYHCGDDVVQMHSSLENNYLETGFWAQDRAAELVNPGLSVQFLVRVEDVTERILNDIYPGMPEIERAATIERVSREIVREATADNHYQAQVKPFWNGNQYFLQVLEVFRDIRLVGAPPSSIGKFGGDTDNWVYPRHTGDFSIFRIYADSLNRPAEYSPGNVPYTPRAYFSISTSGVSEGDFTLVYGFPGKTEQYLTAGEVQRQLEVTFPYLVGIREARLDIMRACMEDDPGVRIQYTAKYNSVSNAWKKWQGVVKGLSKFEAVSKKRAFEQELLEVAAGEGLGTEAKELLTVLDSLQSEMEEYNRVAHYGREALQSIELVSFAGTITSQVIQGLAGGNFDDIRMSLDPRVQSFYKDYNQQLDKRVGVAMIGLYLDSISPVYHPASLSLVHGRYKGSIEKYVEYIHEHSIFADEARLRDFLGSLDWKSVRKIPKDPAFELFYSYGEMYRDNVIKPHSELTASIDSAYREYLKLQMKLLPEKVFYPDANGTLRVSFGKVEGYSPSDAVKYMHLTSLEGVMEKEDPGIHDYRVPARLKELYLKKDYGDYGHEGILPVCFVASNHTSGGNSGSPVISSRGDLIGINFDRNWEGTMSDIMYDASICRNIVLDIRYILFIIDKFAGANHLLEELTLVGGELKETGIGRN
jgi:hypothetical protein